MEECLCIVLHSVFTFQWVSLESRLGYISSFERSMSLTYSLLLTIEAQGEGEVHSSSHSRQGGIASMPKIPLSQ